MSKISVDTLSGVPVTLLMPLRGRYLETKRPDAIFHDAKSVEIIDAIDHDFDGAELPWEGHMTFTARTQILDRQTSRFIEEHPDAIVVNLGSGLDTRFTRLDNGKVEWFELDLPECIELRRNFFSENERYHFVPKSVLDFSWVGNIPKDRPTLFIAEGLFQYFAEEDVRSILRTIQENFAGSEVIFEAFSPLIQRAWHKHSHLQRSFSLFKWMIHSGRKMEKWWPGIEFVDEYHYVAQCPQRWKWMRMFNYVPPLRQILKMVHLRLNAAA